MKKLVLTCAATLAAVAAFAQGRVQFGNDSLHLVYFDSSVAGKTNGEAVWTGGGESTINGTPYTFLADYYLGTSSSSLSLVSSTTFNSTSPGKPSLANYSAPGIAGGTTVYIVEAVRDSGGVAAATLTPAQIASGASGLGASEGATFFGIGTEFSFVLGTSTASYPPMYSKGVVLGGGSSTWANGTQDMSAYGAGNVGAVGVSAVPEPATFALAGLGAAAALIFRRRK